MNKLEKIREIEKRELKHVKWSLVTVIATTTLLLFYPNIFSLTASLAAVALTAMSFASLNQTKEILKILEEGEAQ